MKNLTFMIAVMVVGNAAIAADIQIFKNATITTCGDESEGCASDLISSDGKTYLVDQDYAATFLKAHGHFFSSKDGSVKVREVMGVVIKESGHFPNPTAEFSVVKIIKIVE